MSVVYWHMCVMYTASMVTVTSMSKLQNVPPCLTS